MATINDMIKEGKIWVNPANPFELRYSSDLLVTKEAYDDYAKSVQETDINAYKFRKLGESDLAYKNRMTVQPIDTKGKKYNEGKPMLAQFYKHFPNAYKAMVDNATYGFEKYQEDINDPNWKKNEIWEYEDALFRHFTSYLTGEIYDAESGKEHLAAVIWNACVLYELNKIKKENNNGK